MSWKMRTSKKGGCDGQHCSSQASLGTYRYHQLFAGPSWCFMGTGRQPGWAVITSRHAAEPC